jgi:hypothetical protein
MKTCAFVALALLAAAPAWAGSKKAPALKPLAASPYIPSAADMERYDQQFHALPNSMPGYTARCAERGQEAYTMKEQTPQWSYDMTPEDARLRAIAECHDYLIYKKLTAMPPLSNKDKTYATMRQRLGVKTVQPATPVTPEPSPYQSYYWHQEFRDARKREENAKALTAICMGLANVGDVLTKQSLARFSHCIENNKDILHAK